MTPTAIAKWKQDNQKCEIIFERYKILHFSNIMIAILDFTLLLLYKYISIHNLQKQKLSLISSLLHFLLTNKYFCPPVFAIQTIAPHTAITLQICFSFSLLKAIAKSNEKLLLLP